MRIFFDTEFIEDGKTITLLSIGLVREDGKDLYLENSDADWNRADPWVRKNVLPKMETWEWTRIDLPSGRLDQPHWDAGHPSCYRPKAQIAERVLEFVGDVNPEFWAYYADYDWVVLCQLFGRMIDLPEGWPKYCHDFKQLIGDRSAHDLVRLPKSEAHNALTDAKWLRECFEALYGRRPCRRCNGTGACADFPCRSCKGEGYFTGVPPQREMKLK